MLGSYLKDAFNDKEITTLGRNDTNDYVCDLTKEEPDFSNAGFDTVIHCAGTESDDNAFPLNYEGTKRLIESLSRSKKGGMPKEFVYISSYKVYGDDAGENVDEEAALHASSEAGMSKARAEEFLREWAAGNDVTLTIMRPARMFGNGVAGEALRLFNDAINGKYIHVRGNDARQSLVCAYDVARAVRKVYKSGGLYNAADGVNPRFLELVEAMTANAGAKKRMTCLPSAWAEWLWRLGRWVPSIDRHLNPAVVSDRMKTLTIDGSRLAKDAEMIYFNTIDVIEHTAKGYPYSA